MAWSSRKVLLFSNMELSQKFGYPLFGAPHKNKKDHRVRGPIFGSPYLMEATIWRMVGIVKL